MCCQVTHASQLEDHPDRGDDGAQLTCHRRLEGQEGQAAILELLVHGVELGIVGDDRLRAG